MQTKTLLKVGVAILLPVALTACGDRNRNSPTPAPAPAPTPTPTSFQSKLGANFAGVFNASNTSEPKEPTAADVPALNATADPLDN